jgi:hypothetical protein
MEHAVKFGTSSLVSYPIYSYFFSGNNIKTNIFGSVSAPIILAGLSGVSYLVSDLVHDQVFPALHVSEKFAQPASALLNVGANYGANYGMLEVIASGVTSEMGMTNLLLASGGSAMASHYMYNNFVAPWYGYGHTSY